MYVCIYTYNIMIWYIISWTWQVQWQEPSWAKLAREEVLIFFKIFYTAHVVEEFLEHPEAQGYNSQTPAVAPEPSSGGAWIWWSNERSLGETTPGPWRKDLEFMSAWKENRSVFECLKHCYENSLALTSGSWLFCVWSVALYTAAHLPELALVPTKTTCPLVLRQLTLKLQFFGVNRLGTACPVFTVQVLKALPVSLTQESHHSILFVKDGLCFTLIDLFLGNLLRTLLMHKLHGMLFFVVRMYLSCTQRGIISHSII